MAGPRRGCILRGRPQVRAHQLEAPRGSFVGLQVPRAVEVCLWPGHWYCQGHLPQRAKPLPHGNEKLSVLGLLQSQSQKENSWRSKSSDFKVATIHFVELKQDFVRTILRRRWSDRAHPIGRGCVRVWSQKPWCVSQFCNLSVLSRHFA